MRASMQCTLWGDPQVGIRKEVDGLHKMTGFAICMSETSGLEGHHTSDRRGLSLRSFEDRRHIF
eukprot:525438-Pelagomonas_calceolata.AAC.9